MATSPDNATATTPVDGAAPQAQAPVAQSAQALHAAATTAFPPASLYVGDLGAEITESMLYDIFKTVGHIFSIKVCRDSVTRRSLGYAYVNFATSVDAERAIEAMNYTVIGKRPCRIMWSHRDPAKRKSGLGNIFIKNLDKTIDNQSLYDTFSEIGTILSCKIETDEKGVSKGYGYIHFETEEDAKAAIERVNGKLMAGKIVYVGPFLSRSERKTDELKLQKYTNVYVKNLDASVDTEKLKELFSKYGPITSAVVMMSSKGTSRGFGFVNFETHDAATAAVAELHNSVIAGKTLYVARHQSKSERAAELRKIMENSTFTTPPKHQGLNLYVKNLADAIDDDGLRQLFAPHGTITSAVVMRDDKRGSKGFGFVCFSQQTEAMKAIGEMNGILVHGKPIYVALAQKKEQRRAQLEALYTRNYRFPATTLPGAGIFPPPGVYYPPTYAQQRMVYPMGPRPWAAQGARSAQNPRQGQPYQQFPGTATGAPRNRPVSQQRRPAAQPAPGMKAESYVVSSGAKVKFVASARNPPTIPPATPVTEAAYLQLAPVQAAVPEEDPKQVAGERLYGQVQQVIPHEHCGKITGMLLESLGIGQVMDLLSDQTGQLEKKIREAFEVLQEHIQKQEAQ